MQKTGGLSGLTSSFVVCPFSTYISPRDFDYNTIIGLYGGHKFLSASSKSGDSWERPDDPTSAHYIERGRRGEQSKA